MNPWEIRTILPEKLKELFKNSPLIISDDIEGQRLDDNGDVVIGTRCGPLYNNLEALCHEMCHFVEIDERRMGQFKWGMKFGTGTGLYNRFQEIRDFNTAQATKRELRVLAFQYNLQVYLGIQKETLVEHCSAMEYMPDFYCVLSDKELLNDAELPDLGAMGYTHSKKTLFLIEWTVKKYLEVYTLEKFLSEWHRRNEIMWKRKKNRMRKPRPEYARSKYATVI